MISPLAGLVHADPYTEELQQRIAAAETQLQVDPQVTLEAAAASPATYAGRCIRIVGTVTAASDLAGSYPGFAASELTLAQDSGSVVAMDLIGGDQVPAGTRIWALVTLAPPNSARPTPRVVVYAPLTPVPALTAPAPGPEQAGAYLSSGAAYSAGTQPVGGTVSGPDPAVVEQYQFLSYLNLVRYFNPRLSDAEVGQVVTSLFRYAAFFQVSRPFIAALIRAESNFNPRSVSSAGAAGLCQLMPGTAQSLGVGNAFDIDQNIRGGVQYLALQLQRFADRPNDERFALALACYNAGPRAVENNGGVPPYPETQGYIRRIAETFNELWRQGYR